MKTLSEVCNDTLNIAKKTDNSLVVSPSSSTNNVGLMIMNPQQLMQKTPEENDKSLIQCLRHTLNLSLNIEKKTIFTEYGAEFIPFIKIDKMNIEEKQKALAMVQNFAIQAPKEEIATLIARLQIIAPEREKNTVDVKARTRIFIEELEKYPADVVNKVLRMRYKWFPTLAELLENCENECAMRKLIERGIRCFYCES